MATHMMTQDEISPVTTAIISQCLNSLPVLYQSPLKPVFKLLASKARRREILRQTMDRLEGGSRIMCRRDSIVALAEASEEFAVALRQVEEDITQVVKDMLAGALKQQIEFLDHDLPPRTTYEPFIEAIEGVQLKHGLEGASCAPLGTMEYLKREITGWCDAIVQSIKETYDLDIVASCL